MHVVAVGAAEPVVLTLHRTDHTGADRFLAVVEVHEAKHLAPVVHLGAFVLEAPAQGHVPVQLQTGLPVHAGPLCRHQFGEPFGMGTSSRSANRSGIDSEVLTHVHLRDCDQL